METTMKTRTLIALVAVGLAFAAPARAEIVIGGNTYSDAEQRALQEACRGLEAQSRMSLTSSVPDDVDNGDANSEYNLKQLPFTLADCRAAGIR
jgi:hypothetical protein